jgi:uncharacterized protein YcbK (DUF882 family)
MQLTDHFSLNEFECKCGCGANGINADLVRKLESIRVLYDKPMCITSGLRCSFHNEGVGGSDSSAHLTGEAVDVSCETSVDRHRLINLFLKEFNRVGIAKTFIHVDVSRTKAQDVIWVY